MAHRGEMRELCAAAPTFVPHAALAVPLGRQYQPQQQATSISAVPLIYIKLDHPGRGILCV